MIGIHSAVPYTNRQIEKFDRRTGPVDQFALLDSVVGLPASSFVGEGDIGRVVLPAESLGDQSEEN